MFVTGPDVVKAVIHEEVSKEELGGAMTHSSKSGVTHFMCNTEEELLMSIRELLSFLPQNNMDEAKKKPYTDETNREDTSLDTIVPVDPNVPYDMKDIIERVIDNGYFFEVMPNFAKNIIIGFARMAGRSVGIVANQPAYLAGVLDIDASDKASRFYPFLRLLQYSIDYIRRCSGIPSGIYAGKQWYHPSRCKNSLCICRSHCSQTDSDYPQSLRWCLYRNELQADRS